MLFSIFSALYAHADFNLPYSDLSRIDGIWINKKEIAQLPVSGPAWEQLSKLARMNVGVPDLSNQDDQVNVQILAKALIYVRLGTEEYRTQVIHACMTAIGTEKGGRTLSLGRELIAYVIAADLVGLPQEKDRYFRKWLRESLSENLQGRTLRSTQEDRPNNWGTHAGASRAAVALYLRDPQELHNTARVFKGYLGDRSAYSGFKFGSLDWQADPSQPVGINPMLSRKDGHNVDGVLPDDQRRCCKQFTWPAPYENYVFEGLQGALSLAMLLHRAGYDVWNWQDKALLRAFNWLYYEAGHKAKKDDSWEPYVINHFYATDFPVDIPSRPGKGIGFTDWLFASQ